MLSTELTQMLIYFYRCLGINVLKNIFTGRIDKCSRAHAAGIINVSNSRKIVQQYGSVFISSVTDFFLLLSHRGLDTETVLMLTVSAEGVLFHG